MYRLNCYRAVTLLLSCFIVGGPIRMARGTSIPANTVPGYTMTSVSAEYRVRLAITASDTRSQRTGLCRWQDWRTRLRRHDDRHYGSPARGAITGFPVNLYYTAVPPDNVSIVDGGQTSGTLVPGFSATVTPADPILSLSGGTYTSGDGFRYSIFSSPLTLPAGTYELVESQFATSFGQFPTSLAAAPGVSGMVNVDYILPNNVAGYATNVSVLTSAFGPNLLVVVPEPTSGSWRRLAWPAWQSFAGSVKRMSAPLREHR